MPQQQISNGERPQPAESQSDRAVGLHGRGRTGNEGEPCLIPALDGFSLGGTLFRPKVQEDRAIVIIHPAFGVRAAAYAPLARFLASRGFPVLTFDYRGIGASIGNGPTTIQDPMHTWATLDMRGVQRWIQTQGFARHHIVGHSGGAWLLAYLPPAPSQATRSMVFVAAPDGYWGHYGGLARLRMLATWHWWLPRQVKRNGALLRNPRWQGESLPPRVALDWASVCLQRDFIEYEGLEFPAKYAASHVAPTLALSFSDDTYAPASSARALLRRFRSLPLEHRAISPGDLGKTEIGHFGFLRPSRKKDLWVMAADWLERHP